MPAVILYKDKLYSMSDCFTPKIYPHSCFHLWYVSPCITEYM